MVAKKVALALVAAALAAVAALLLYSYVGRPAAQEREIVVNAAPIVKQVLDQAAKAFENQTGIKVLISYEPSGTTYAKLSQGVPIDVAIFASKEWGDKAKSAGLVDPTTETGLGYQLILLYIRKSLPFADKITCIDDMANYSLRIGIANPAVAPGGYEAMWLINQSKYADMIRPKVVVAKDMGELLSWYQMGSVDAAFLWNNYNKTLYNFSIVVLPWRCGYNVHVYYAVAYVASTSKHKDLAMQFVEFLGSDYVKRLAKDSGFFATYQEAEQFIRASSS